MTVKLQKLYRFQTLKLLEAINREDVDNQFWAVSSYKDNWSLADVFGSESDTVFEMGDYITVMYDNENWFPAYTENRDICKFPHYDARVDDDLRVLIFKIKTMRRNGLVLELNIADFLAEYFTGSTCAKDQFSYGMFWDKINEHRDSDKINIFTGHKPKTDGSFYYEYGLLKAEEEMEAEKPVAELELEDGVYGYNICYENPDEEPVSFYFYTRTRIAAFIQHDNEVMNLAAEMREITQQKPILCLESHTRLFRSALDSILQAYSKGEYSNEDLQKEYCPDVTEVYTDWMRYKFRCSNEYEAYMLMVGDVEGNNVCNAIDAAWNWFHTGFVNNFISKDPETNLLHLNW